MICWCRFPVAGRIACAGDAGGEVGRQRQGLIERVWCAATGYALRCRHRLDSGAHHIVENVLRGQRPTQSLTMRAQRQRARVLRVEPVLRAWPTAARRAHFCDFNEKIHADRPEERQPRRKTVDVDAGGQTCAEIFEASPAYRRARGLRRPGFLHVKPEIEIELYFGIFCEVCTQRCQDDPH